MSDNVESVTLEVLKSIQESLVQLERKVDGVGEKLSNMFDNLSTKLDRFDCVMSRRA